jgi:hypothetical protein
MGEIVHDDDGFTCICGVRNDYPSYVKEHWSVRLSYSCSCHRKYILFRGTVTKNLRESPEVADSEAFGD